MKKKILVTQPTLSIVRQPQKRGYRFRYASEGLTHGGVRGMPHDGEITTGQEKMYPTVKISGYRGPAKIVVTVVTANTEETQLHAHSLVVNREETKGFYVFDVPDGTDPMLEMTSVAIQHVEKKKQEEKLMDRILQTQFLQKFGWSRSMVQPDAQQYSDLEAFTRSLMDRDECSGTFHDRVQNKELTSEKLEKLRKDAGTLAKSMNMGKCRLCFQAFIHDENGLHFSRKLDPVYSDVIHDAKTAAGAELKIIKISKVVSEAKGGEEVWILSDKLTTGDVEVLFIFSVL